MTEQTLVAVYDTAAHADAAIRDLEAADVPSSAISRHAQGTTAGTTAAAAPDREPGFWASLFGSDSTDSAVYDRSLESGSTVVTVKVPEQHVTRVSGILERHNPIDVDERASSYGVSGTTTTTRTPSAPVAPTGTTAGSEDEKMQLAEETLSVGKRAVNRGTTRIRRYVVETPVQEQVTLRSENVTVDRRPVSDGRPVTGADFTDKVVEMTETSEEAVVSKTARVKEEVALRKEATERVETVKDTVRSQEVEVEEVPDTERTKSTAPVTPTGKTTTGNTTTGNTTPRAPKI
jgi:uncharacterized protein (TIGR02271 family)